MVMIMLMYFSIAAGQDPYFSQFYSGLLNLNPAYTGSAQIHRFAACYRNQAPALGSPFVTYMASYDRPVEILQGGFGVSLHNDVQGQGILSRLSADLMYAYHMVVNPELMLNAGFQASYSYRLLRTSGMILPDGLDPSGIYLGHMETVSDQRSGHPDFAVGFLAYTRNAYAGVSMHHLTRPNMSLSRSGFQPLPRKLTLHGGVYISLYERRFGREALKLNPNLVYLHQAGFRQLNYGMDAIYQGVYGGIWLRHGMDFQISTLSMHFGYEQAHFRIGYAYDFSMRQPWSEISNMGAHEISILLKLNYNKMGSGNKLRTIKCPRI